MAPTSNKVETLAATVFD